MDWNRLIELIKGKQVYLQTHNFPDPDALASAYGLQKFLGYHGITSIICYDGNIVKNSTKRMMDIFGIVAIHIDELEEMNEQDYIIIVDAQNNNSNISQFPGIELACVDHHPTVAQNEHLYSDIRICGACSTIVATYFKDYNIEPDENTASVLLYGIKMDTDSFNRGVTQLDIEMFSFLHDKANNKKIISLYNNNMELEDLYAYGEAIRNIKIYDNVGFARISFDCPDALVAMISDFILELDVVEFSVVYAARNGGYKFSVRNESDRYHAGTIAQIALRDLGGGGGHFSMAGGLMTEQGLSRLGSDSDMAIRSRFMEAIRQTEKNEMEKEG